MGKPECFNSPNDINLDDRSFPLVRNLRIDYYPFMGLSQFSNHALLVENVLLGKATCCSVPQISIEVSFSNNTFSTGSTPYEK